MGKKLKAEREKRLQKKEKRKQAQMPKIQQAACQKKGGPGRAGPSPLFLYSLIS
jgi:hypothetical protein